MDMCPQLAVQEVQLKIKKLHYRLFPPNWFVGWMETKQKQKRQTTSVHHSRLPILAPKALWRARAQAIPLPLTVVRTSQRPQSRSMVRSAAGTKHCKHKLWRLSILIKHR